MVEPKKPTVNVSMPDPDLEAFGRVQADIFCGGNFSEYVRRLIEIDRADGTLREDLLRRLGTAETAAVLA